MAITRATKGTQADKSGGTTTTITSFSLAANTSLIVGVVNETAGPVPESVVWNSINLDLDKSRTDTGSGGDNGSTVSIWSTHDVGSASSACVVTWGSSTDARVAIATEVTEINLLDKTQSASQDDSASPSSGSTAPTTAE